ncbi:dihydrolipoamide acetyltransferase family protein [Pseudorhodoferax sp.]|uniref:dihydrolipoamide acetyltransferase family protein n=1 Tax=Pseudorhodoferax sp. TaxID=1993553 RepID=UPI0039E5FB90
MRRDLLLPKLGLTMTEGTLVEWLVKPGQAFKIDQSLFVIESEKAAVEVPAEADGTLLDIAAEVGATLTVGTVIGQWDDGLAPSPAAGDAVTSTSESAAAAPAPAGLAAPPIAAPAAEARTAASAGPAPASPSGRLLSTPLARRLARERGIDLAAVAGSGPRGRIRARDIPGTPGAAAMPVGAGPAGQGGRPQGALRPATSIEGAIARRLVEAKQEIPHFYLAVEAEVSALQKLRAELNAAQSDVRFTVNHFIVAAVGRALAELAELNSVWTADGILTLADADVGMAVDTARGVMVPVLRAPGRRPLAAVARDAVEAAARAQAGRLSAEDMRGGAITVSNAGMHDVTYMASIINPGQAMILGVGSIRGVFRPDPEGRPAVRHEMGMVLSADHRVLDGVRALKFLKRVVRALEHPLELLVS